MTERTKARKISHGDRAWRRGKRVRFILLYALFIVVLLEISSRLYWSIGDGVSFLVPDLFHAFYPEMKKIEAAPGAVDDNTFDVLILGGSVVYSRWADIDNRLGKELHHRTKRNVRIYNASKPGHTTRDSMLKYQRLGTRSFDLVLVYHGINEARANNCPPEMFRGDYSHYAWYAHINGLADHPEHRYVVLPYTGSFLVSTIAERLGLVQRVPKAIPNDKWVQFGADIKTAEPFRRNLTRIVELARGKNEPLLLMTFATHMPPNYSQQQLRQRQPNLRGTALAVELWGRPGDVTAAVRAHNEVIEGVAQQYGTLFVDQDSLIPKDYGYFNDICHLSPDGCERYVANILEVVLEVMRQRFGPDKR